MSNEGIGEAVKVLLDKGKLLGGVAQVDDEIFKYPVAYLPDGIKAQSLKEFAKQEPKAKVNFLEPESFCEYLNKYKDPRCMVFASGNEGVFLAVLDYHSESKPGAFAEPGKHEVILQMGVSEQRIEWSRVFKPWMPQEDFSEFLEDHAHEISDPDGSAILDIANELKAIREVTFDSVKRNTDGDNDFSFREKTSAVGELEVPSKVTVRIPLFEGSPPVEIQCLLRYRLRSGGVSFYLRPVRLREMIREGLEKTRSLISESTGHFVHVGDVMSM